MGKPKQKPNKPQTRKSTEQILCHACKNSLDDGTDSFQCELCELWVCLPCSKVPKAAYDLLNTMEQGASNFIWMCDGCKVGLPTLNKLSKAVDGNTQRFDEIERKKLMT